MSRLIVMIALALCMPRVHGQAMGINMGGEFSRFSLKKGGQGSIAGNYYLAIHRDFSNRIGASLQAGYGSVGVNTRSIDVIYKAKYFVTDNDESAFYLGSFIGYQKMSGSYSRYTPQNPYSGGTVSFSHGQVPIGLTCGVRGGLAGYFAELSCSLGYAIGGGAVLIPEQPGSYTNGVTSSSLYLSVGFSWLGFGWDER
jgi:hypothetical protein